MQSFKRDVTTPCPITALLLRSPRPFFCSSGSDGATGYVSIPKVSHGMAAVEMAATVQEETPAVTAEGDAPPEEATEEGRKDKGPNKPETEEPGGSVEPKKEEANAEAGEETPGAAADKAPSEAVTEAAGDNIQESVAAPEEAEAREPKSEEPNNEPAMKEVKEEPGEERRCAGIDGEKPSGGGGEMSDKRRPSVEISSSDGEPLSRMDSEDRWVGVGQHRLQGLGWEETPPNLSPKPYFSTKSIEQCWGSCKM